MPIIQDCDIGIEVDGRRLEEHGTQIVGTTATTWIESEAGKVHIYFTHNSRKLLYTYAPQGILNYAESEC